MRHYFNKLFAIMEERGLDNGHLINDGKIPLPVINQIYSGYNIHRDYVFKLQKYLGVDYTQFMEWNKDEEELKPKEDKKRREPRPVWKCDLRHNHLKKYIHGGRAGEVLGKDPAPIYRCLDGKQKTAYGFMWEYADIANSRRK